MAAHIPTICPACGALIAAEAQDLARGFVRCKYCSVRMTATPPHLGAGPAPARADAAALGASSYAGAGPGASTSASPIRPLASLPKGMHVEDDASLKISRRWRGVQTWILLVFAIIWNGFMVFWNGFAFSEGVGVMAAFGLLHTAVGIFLAYKVLAELLNTTQITVADGNISVAHAPIPWPGAKTVDATDILQFYCRQKIHRSKNGVTYSYSLCYINSKNIEQKLLGGLQSPEQALFLEQELERKLGILNRPVAGAFS